MRPGGYHEESSHTEPLQGNAVARWHHPSKKKIIKCCVHITSYKCVKWVAASSCWTTCTGCLLSKSQYKQKFLTKERLWPRSLSQIVPLRPPLHHWTYVKNSVSPCIPSSLLVWPDSTLTTMTISTYTDMQVTYLPFCQMQEVPLKHQYTTRIHIFTPQTRVFTASVGDTQIFVS